LLTEALSILDKENGILANYSLAGNMHYTGEKTVCHGKNDAEGKIHFTMEKFATELTKYLELTLKQLQPTKTLSTGL
jgi:succinylarginine dihydrolase